jgi:DNA polymerase-3 subunit chi
MTDIQFYHLTSAPLERVLPKLLEKALQGGFKALVLMESEARVESMNTALWTYDPASFLPHGSAADGHAAEQPIYLTASEGNPNHANLLVVTDGSELELDGQCRRLLDIFDGNDEQMVAKALARRNKYQAEGHAVSYIRQNPAGGWEKQSA